MACVYRHIRLDKNEVFYIGIGTEEERSTSRDNRTKHWHNVVKKAGYQVEIVMREVTWEQACFVEKYLINHYGRKNLGLGNLVNLTDGGEGVPGMKHSQKTKDLISEQNKTPERRAIAMENLKKTQTPEARAKALANRDYSFMSDPDFIKKRVANTDYKALTAKIDTIERAKNLRIPVTQYDVNMNVIKEWKSGIEASKELNISYKSLNLCLRGKIKTSSGFIWKYKDMQISVKNHDKERGLLLMKPVLQYNKDNIFIKEWDSVLTASLELKIHKSSIAKCCSDKRPSAGGYIWKYKNDNN